MGGLLKEALRCLCRESGWSYAVFWKIACQNPSLLVWEEGHYELARHSDLSGISKIGSSQFLPKEWVEFWNSPEDDFGQLKRQEEDGIDILVNKMMMPQVHVVGEGIVGRAAFMGNHQWILRESYFDHGPMSESQPEVKHQFTAGIQTIAVIPVLPHGVVQLGSIQMIIENLGFVSYVKSLFVQLGNVPGALLSDNMRNASSQKMQVPDSHGISVSADHSRNACSRVTRFTPLIGDNSNQQLLRSPASRLVSQPSCSLVTQIHNNVQANPLLVPLSSNPTGTTMAKSHDIFFHPKAVSVVKPGLSLGGRLENEVMGTSIIIPNPCAQLDQYTPPCTSSSANNHPTSIVRTGVPCRSLTFMEQQILLSSVRLREHANNYLPTSPKNTKTHQLRSHGCTASFKDSVTVPLLGRSESPCTGNDLGMVTSISNQYGAWRSVDSNPFCSALEGIALQSDMGVVPMSKHPDYSNSTHFLSVDSLPRHHSTDFKHTGTVGTPGKQRMQKDMFKSLENPSAESKEPISRFGFMPLGSLEGCRVSSSKPDKGSQNAICEKDSAFTTNCGDRVRHSNENQPHRLNEKSSDTTIRVSPAGSDLFDVLGLDFKIQQLRHGLNDMLLHGADEHSGNLKADVSACLRQLDVPLIFNPMNDGISESGSFSESGTDNLLDAVVSKIHSSAKQILADNVSCKTIPTKAGSSLNHNNSTYNGMSAPEQIQDLFGHALAKPDIAGSNSVKTSCSLNRTEECSQTDSAYKSQISSWVEDGQNIKGDGISTTLSKRADEAGKSNRKRPRPGENPRPRPKDRQMIQDRVKELREIVPNGVKCSIDALLERTIKHLVFLQSVTKHADKLKQTGESKIIDKEEVGLLFKDNFEGGKTLAFDVSSQSMVCPIIVQDLNQPRQMLIEMLCEERGFFLEIADMIRGLGLTILKGVMEAQDDKIWARFAVEANRDVTRMNVFLSLARLLEQTMSSTLPRGFDGCNVGHKIYHQSNIPVTGLADAFQ